MKNLTKIYNYENFKKQKIYSQKIGLIFIYLMLILSIMNSSILNNNVIESNITQISLGLVMTTMLVFCICLLACPYLLVTVINEKFTKKEVQDKLKDVSVNDLLDLYKKVNTYKVDNLIELAKTLILYFISSVMLTLSFVMNKSVQLEMKNFEMIFLNLALFSNLLLLVVCVLSFLGIFKLNSNYIKSVRKVMNKKKVVLNFYKDDDINIIQAKSIQDVIKLIDKGYSCCEKDLIKVLKK